MDYLNQELSCVLSILSERYCKIRAHHKVGNRHILSHTIELVMQNFVSCPLNKIRFKLS